MPADPAANGSRCTVVGHRRYWLSGDRDLGPRRRGYQGDCTDWGLEVVERVDSARVTRLYDIYHMQIMEGDVIRTIGDRRDGLRRLCRTRVCAKGEVVPALRQAFALCDV